MQTSKQAPAISIVIPTYNEEKTLPQLLTSIANQDFQDFEVIIADANSTDNTRELAKAFGAKVIDGGMPGPGRNKGAASAKGNHLLFVDADMAFQPNFISEFFTKYQEAGLDLALPLYDNSEISSLKYKLNFQSWNLSQKLMQYTPFPIGSSQVMLFNKAAFDRIGGFNEQILLSEDIDIIKKVVRSKLKFRMLPQKVYPSTRRFDNHGLLRAVGAGVIGMMLVYLGVAARSANIQKRILSIYGGLGNS